MQLINDKNFLKVTELTTLELSVKFITAVFAAPAATGSVYVVLTLFIASFRH